MSLKDKGNEEFKKNNLEKAIEYYSRYVEQDNNDNELAFTNMAMCYFKLKNYQKTIEACESALKEKKELPKAYYRLYLTYKEMPNEEYQAFLNSYLFLKYFNEESPSSKAEAFKIMRQFKEKFIKKQIRPEVKLEQGLINDLANLSFQNQNTQRIIEEPNTLLQCLRDENISLTQKCQKIRQVALSQQYEYGINLAYLLLNISQKLQDKTYIKEQINQIKHDYSQKYEIKQEEEEEREDVSQKEQMNEESQENLFQSESDKPVESVQSPTIVQNQSKIEEQEPKNSQNKTIAAIQIAVKTENNKMQVETPSPAQNNEPIEKQIESFLKKASNSRDIFKDLKETICKMLLSNEQTSLKRKYLNDLQKKIKEVSFIKTSLSIKEQKQIYCLLQRSGLQDLSEVYAPKGK